MNFTKKLLFVALVATTLLACQKDEVQTPIQSNDELGESAIEFRSSGDLTSEFRNWYDIKKNKIQPNTVVSPFLNRVVWNSGQPFDVYDGNSMIYNVEDNPYTDVPNAANNLVFTKEPNSEISVKSLIYIAKESFYSEHNITPRISNFTGYVLEYSELEALNKVYAFELGQVVDLTTNEGPIIQASEEPSEVPDDCPQWAEGCYGGSGGGIFGWVGSVGSWIGGIGSTIGGWIGGAGSTIGGWFNGTGTGTGIGSGYGGGGNIWKPGTAIWNGSGSGHVGGSGGGAIGIAACIPSNFWSIVDYDIKKDYILALSSLMDLYHIQDCRDPFATEAELVGCQTSDELLCKGIENGCILVVSD